MTLSLPVPPPRPPVPRFVCGAGTGPCGNPDARLYPSGWRCEECKPRRHTNGVAA